MSLINIVMLSLGGLIILSALAILLISLIIETIVDSKKRRNKKLLPTETVGVYEVEYNISSKITRLNELFLKYKSFAILSLVFGGACASVPLLQFIVSTVTTLFPK